MIVALGALHVEPNLAGLMFLIMPDPIPAAWPSAFENIRFTQGVLAVRYRGVPTRLMILSDLL